ncbi:MAG: NAD(P)/FAD-dependent oxidoreductase [Acetivibrio ethanolgignens]
MRYIVLGASAAGVNGAMELRRLDPDCEILLISKDEEIYSRCILHQYLAEQRSLEQLCFVGKDFEKNYRVDLRKGIGCTGVCPEKKEILLSDGTTEGYDKLLIATGAHTYLPPIKNLREAKNVTGFRNIEDIEAIREAAETKKNIIMLGSGLVGLDCATGLLERKVSLSLVEMEQWLLNKQLDARAAKVYQDIFAERGVKQYYGVGISELILDENKMITEVVLTDGRHLPCDYCIVTAGVRANVEFLKESGIEINKFGLVYDAAGKTSDDNIYGAGDVSGTSPIWPVAVKEGIIAASNMAGVERKMTDFFASKSTMNFFGIPSMSLGEVNPAPEEEVQVEIKETEISYKKILHKHGRITGAILQGDLDYGGILQQLIARKIDISRVKKPIFDIDYSDFFHMDENLEYFYED